jgi:16S rRNA (cytosine1402-N4)-methyltransferase
MRMNPNRGQPASAWLRKSRPADVAAVLEENADEPHALELASALAGQLIERTSDLTDLIRATLSRVRDNEREQSVRRVFQALRIAVNEELIGLASALTAAAGRLGAGGRMVAISFQSLEDRIVKHTWRALEAAGQVRILTRRPVTAGEAEMDQNPRARSAKLRALECVREGS